MKTPTILLLGLVSVAALGCKPHPANDRGEARHGGLRRECSADLDKFCAADQTGRDRRQCLKSHQDQLSDACKAFLAERGQRGGHRHRDQGGD